MSNWLKKKQSVFIIGILVVLFSLAIWSFYFSSPLPSTIQDDRFSCTVWTDSVVELQSNGDFIVSSDDGQFYYSQFDPAMRHFSEYSTNCENGCAFLGELENIKQYGRFQEDKNSAKRSPVALVSTENVVYGCYPKGLS